jgi:galactokinase
MSSLPRARLDTSLATVAGVFASRFGDRKGARAWWVPGRIEVLGKHVDYGGGRSLLTTVNRGFYVLARPRSDNRVHLVDARSGYSFTGAIDIGQPSDPGRWSDYPATVLRRLARDFPTAATGMDAVLASSLPSAAGLSSSSALVIAVFLPLHAFNRLDSDPAWLHAVPDRSAMAEYLGAVENGRAYGEFPVDFGVGTQGGSQDHTAILASESERLVQYRFLPVARESSTELPAAWTFVVVSCGVSAAKAGGAKDRYNALSGQMVALLEAWRQISGETSASLLDVLTNHPDAEAQLMIAVRSRGDAASLQRRLQQFRAECCEIIPAVVSSLVTGNMGFGELVDRSQRLADEALDNQVEETRYLARRARELGAAAASAFGAGFGGSVWALVQASEAPDFQQRLVADYIEAFPATASRVDAFNSRPGAAAHEIS